MESTSPQNLNAIIFGATGAVGRELTDYLLQSPSYSTVTVIVRRTIDRWDNLPSDSPLRKKLNIIKVDSLDFLSGDADSLKSKLNSDIKYDVIFNTLGGRSLKGKEEFRKVDYTYVVQSCEMCEKLNIPHFSNCSAANANKNSWVLYSKTKGEAEEECLKKNVDYVSIFRPGIILDRDNDYRAGEAIVAHVPFLPKISAKDIALSMMTDDLDYQKEKKGGKRRFEHKEMEQIVLRVKPPLKK